jgi:hypothetical protein
MTMCAMRECLVRQEGSVEESVATWMPPGLKNNWTQFNDKIKPASVSACGE